MKNPSFAFASLLMFLLAAAVVAGPTLVGGGVGSSIVLNPGPLQVGGAGISSDAGLILTGGSGGITTNVGSTGNNNMIKNDNVNFTGMTQFDTGQSLVLYSNSFPSLKVGVGNAGVSSPYTFTSTIASGSVAFQSETGAKTCLGSSAVGCLTYETANTSVNSTVAIASPTEFTSFTVAPNALLTAITFGGTITAAKPFTVTGVTLYVSVQSTSTAANTVFTITDGTNTCTATFTCNSTGIASFQGVGAKRVTTANGAGTGCVYAASTPLTIAVTTQGCATAATVTNINVVGKWQ